MVLVVLFPLPDEKNVDVKTCSQAMFACSLARDEATGADIASPRDANRT